MGFIVRCLFSVPGMSKTLLAMVLAMGAWSPVVAEEAESNVAPALCSLSKPTKFALPPDQLKPLPLPPPAPLPLTPKAEKTLRHHLYNLEPDAEDVIGEVRLLAAAKRFNEALAVLRSYRVRHPEDAEARRLELAIEVDQNEYRMRSLIDDQRRDRLVVLANPSYLTAKAAATRPLVKRLEVAEFLLQQQRLPEALSTANAILSDFLMMKRC